MALQFIAHSRHEVGDRTPQRRQMEAASRFVLAPSLKHRYLLLKGDKTHGGGVRARMELGKRALPRQRHRWGNTVKMLRK
jgi:hypothetical protein